MRLSRLRRTLPRRGSAGQTGVGNGLAGRRATRCSPDPILSHVLDFEARDATEKRPGLPNFAAGNGSRNSIRILMLLALLFSLFRLAAILRRRPAVRHRPRGYSLSVFSAGTEKSFFTDAYPLSASAVCHAVRTPDPFSGIIIVRDFAEYPPRCGTRLLPGWNRPVNGLSNRKVAMECGE